MATHRFHYGTAKRSGVLPRARSWRVRRGAGRAQPATEMHPPRAAERGGSARPGWQMGKGQGWLCGKALTVISQPSFLSPPASY